MTIIVAGLGRCGTTLVMKMLEAAGCQTIGGQPAFEDQASARLAGNMPEQWAASLGARATKLLDPQRFEVPAIPNARIFWLTRNRREQARSALKLLNSEIPTAINRDAVRQMESGLRRDEPAALAALEKINAPGLLHLTFEEIIDDPNNSALKICTHAGTRDVAAVSAAAAVVLPRTADCLPYLLEDHMTQALGGNYP